MYNNSEKIAQIHGSDLEDLLKNNKLEIIDVREKYEVDITSIPGARHVPFNILLRTYTELLDKDTVYYILCHTGQRSHYIAKVLTQKGYNVINVDGGIRAMKEYYVHY